MTNDEIFSRVYYGLLDQGVKCRDEDTDKCVYRNAKGQGCAIGLLIPESKYRFVIEGDSLHHAAETHQQEVLHEILFQLDIHTGQFALLMDLQSVHDHYPETAWENELRRVAWNYDLTIPHDAR